MPSQFQKVESLKRIPTDFALWYYKLVEKYAAGKPTYDTDKLVAIMGLAKSAQRALEDEYTWGMFRRGLELSLLWHRKSRHKSSYAETCAARAPSWSWASLNATVCYTHLPQISSSETVAIRIMDVKTAPISSYPLPKLTDKRLKLLSGPLIALEGTTSHSTSRKHVCSHFTASGKYKNSGSWSVWWDVELPEQLVYMLPITAGPMESSNENHTYRVKGLILQQIDKSKKGEFFRVGSFEVEGHERLESMIHDTSLMEDYSL